MILQSLLADFSRLTGLGAFVAWWLAVYLGVQASRSRSEPEAPQAKRNWQFAMLAFVGFLAISIGVGFVATRLGP